MAFEACHRRCRVVDDLQPHVLAIRHDEAAGHRAVVRDGEGKARERIDARSGGEEIAQRSLDLRALRSVEGDPQQAAAKRLVDVLGGAKAEARVRGRPLAPLFLGDQLQARPGSICHLQPASPSPPSAGFRQSGDRRAKLRLIFLQVLLGIESLHGGSRGIRRTWRW